MYAHNSCAILIIILYDLCICATVHYNDVIMGAIAPQIISHTIVYSTVYSGADQRKHQSSALLAFVRGIHPGPVNSPHKWPVTRKVFPFDDVIMCVMVADNLKPGPTHACNLHDQMALDRVPSLCMPGVGGRYISGMLQFLWRDTIRIP